MPPSLPKVTGLILSIERNNFQKTGPILDFMVLLDSAHQELNVCLMDNLLGLAPRTLESIFRILGQAS